MATGTGTQADPRIVFDWTELVQAINDSTMNYIELGADIYAPDTAVGGYNMETTNSIDGKGHSIYNIYIASGICFKWIVGTSSFIYIEPVIKDINFLNVFCQGEALIRIYNYERLSTTFDNVVISGHFLGNSCAIKKGNSDGSERGTFERMGCNIKASSGFTFITKNSTSTYANNYLDCSNSNLKINCDAVIPENKKFIDTRNVSNSRVELNFDTSGNEVVFNKLSTCAVIGTGSGAKVSDASSLTVVEDTLPLDPTSSALVTGVTTAEMKNASYLAGLGFPIGVE